MKKYLSVDDFLSDRSPEVQDVMFFVRNFIRQFNPHITEALQYNCPFFSYRGKKLCYLSSNKKEVYLGFVDGFKIDHPFLKAGDRTQIKIFDLDPSKDIKVKKLREILQKAISLRDDQCN